MSLLARIALVTGSVAISLAALELGCRLLRLGPAGLVEWPNLARERMSNAEDAPNACEFAYDATLGWTMPANCSGPDYNVDAEGLRLTSRDPLPPGPPILVTGSSFAMGSEVADEEAWPAQLQGMLGRRVANGGVGGYSFDQTVLRTEKLAPRLKPFVVIASFTPDDVRRNELKISWSRAKPYFELVDGRLELRNVPVPGERGVPVTMPTASRLLGRSALANLVADRLGIFVGWYYDEARATPPDSGTRVACLLMERLARLDVPVMVVAEYPRHHWLSAERKARARAETAPVLECAAKAGLMPFDMAGALAPMIETRGLSVVFKSEHHGPAGNRATAAAIRDELVRRRLLTTADRASN